MDLGADANASSSVEPTSPRSVDACLQLGIEPCELKFIPQHHFLKNLGDADLADLAFKHHESTRQVSLYKLLSQALLIVSCACTLHTTCCLFGLIAKRSGVVPVSEGVKFQIFPPHLVGLLEACETT